MNSLSIACPSMGGYEAAVTSWQDTISRPWPIVVDDTREGEDAGFLSKCDKAWRETDAMVIGYLHSDLYILENDWDRRVLEQFDDPRVAVVGFVGATGLASKDIYRVKYDFRQLARSYVWSNLVDAEAHGRRETASRQVAVVDSCAVFVRRELLGRVGGWPIGSYPNSSHCSDLWICCNAARHGFNTRMVGVACSHRGGGKRQAGTEWLDARGSDHAMHRAAHLLIADDFRDVLPIRV